MQNDVLNFDTTELSWEVFVLPWHGSNSFEETPFFANCKKYCLPPPTSSFWSLGIDSLSSEEMHSLTRCSQSALHLGWLLSKRHQTDIGIHLHWHWNHYTCVRVGYLHKHRHNTFVIKRYWFWLISCWEYCLICKIHKWTFPFQFLQQIYDILL